MLKLNDLSKKYYRLLKNTIVMKLWKLIKTFLNWKLMLYSFNFLSKNTTTFFSKFFLPLTFQKHWRNISLMFRQKCRFDIIEAASKKKKLRNSFFSQLFCSLALLFLTTPSKPGLPKIFKKPSVKRPNSKKTNSRCLLECFNRKKNWIICNSQD